MPLTRCATRTIRFGINTIHGRSLPSIRLSATSGTKKLTMVVMTYWWGKGIVAIEQTMAKHSMSHHSATQ